MSSNREENSEAKPKSFQVIESESVSGTKIESSSEDETLYKKTAQGKFKKVLKKKVKPLLKTSTRDQEKPAKGKASQNPKKFGKQKIVLKPTDICSLCKTKHEMSVCPKFKTLTYSKRKQVCRDNVLCFHCLSTKHFVRDCKVNMGKLCKVNNCQRYHHELIHPSAEDSASFLEEDKNPFEPLLSETARESAYKLMETLWGKIPSTSKEMPQTFKPKNSGCSL